MSARAGRRLQELMVALVAFATYANSLANQFALDDNSIIATNGRVHQLAHQSLIWLTPYWPGYGQHLGLYRPLTIFGYALQWAAGGGGGLAFHAVSIVLHIVVCILVLALLRRMATPGAALLGALLFAVHPLHTEVVANVVGQAELIAAAAVLGACLLHIDRTDNVRGSGRTAAIVLLFVLGLLAKEGAVVLPGLLVALDFGMSRVRPVRASLQRYAGGQFWLFFALLAALAAYLLLRIAVLGSIGGVNAAPNLPFLRHGHRFLSALRAWPEYARLLVFPIDLVSDYSPGVVLPVEHLSPMVLLGALLLAGTLALFLATPWVRRAGLPAAWFFISVFPVSNLLLPIGVLLAERILYLPSVALSMALAFAWDHYRARFTARDLRLAVGALSAALLALGVRSVLRNPDWKDTDAVWDAIVRDHPESYRSQWVNGYRMAQRGNRQLARGYFEIAYRLWPDDEVLLDNLAGVYVELREYERAVPVLEHARAISDIIDNTELLLACAYLGTQRWADALDASIRADRLNGDRATVFALRAQAYEGEVRYDWAAGAWRVAARQRHGNIPTFWLMLARDLARTQHPTAALAAIDTARSLIPATGRQLQATADSLAGAVAAHCFSTTAPTIHSGAPPAAAPCADPLAAWPIVVPWTAQEVANPLQNATK